MKECKICYSGQVFRVDFSFPISLDRTKCVITILDLLLSSLGGCYVFLNRLLTTPLTASCAFSSVISHNWVLIQTDSERKVSVSATLMVLFHYK